jgi:leucyl-tRNA synthetase
MQEGLEAAVLLLAPIIPHCTDILWRALGHESELLLDASWPRIDERALVRNEILNIVQVNGKKRAEINVSANCPKNEIVSVALADPNVKRAIKGMEVVKIVHVPGRLINIVVR